MDFYLGYMRELETSHSPESTLRNLVEQVKTGIVQAPARVALAMGAALLAAIHDYSNPQALQILPAFRELKESAEGLTAGLDADLEMDSNLWGEEDGAAHKDGQEEGLSKRSLDFAGIENWGDERWSRFVHGVDRITELATASSDGLDSMVRFLTNLHSIFGKIAVDSQKQALIAADRFILAIREETEQMMAEMQGKHQSEIAEGLEDWGNPPEGTSGGLPHGERADAIPSSENHSGLDVSGWKDWGEKEWAIFDQAVVDAQAAATASPADPEPAMRLFLGIRQNIENLELHRRFSMGNVADDLMEAIKQGMAQDLFHVQEKCPCVPWPLPVAQDTKQSPATVPDGTKGRWKKGRIGRELVELNFTHIADWGLAEWAALKIEIDKLSAAAELTMDALGQPGQLLEDIRAHMEQVPPHYRKEAAQMAAKLEQAIGGKVSETLIEIQQLGE